VHGGSWVEGDKAEGAGWRYLNDQGYLVVSANHRLTGYNSKFPVMIEDIKCAVRFLRANASNYNLDPDRIGAVGFSAGGHLVALLGTADASAGWESGEYLDQSSRVQAVITSSGFSDFTQKQYNEFNIYIQYTFGDLGGKATENTINASPVTYVTPDDPPFLIIHGDQDGVLNRAGPCVHEKLMKPASPTAWSSCRTAVTACQSRISSPPRQRSPRPSSTF
jgi:acetyl esterase/lipase